MADKALQHKVEEHLADLSRRDRAVEYLQLAGFALSKYVTQMQEIRDQFTPKLDGNTLIMLAVAARDGMKQILAR